VEIGGKISKKLFLPTFFKDSISDWFQFEQNFKNHSKDIKYFINKDKL
jgi:hypothetical protein